MRRLPADWVWCACSAWRYFIYSQIPTIAKSFPSWKQEQSSDQRDCRQVCKVLGIGQVVFNSTQVQSTLLILQGQIKVQMWRLGKMVKSWAEAGSVPNWEVSHFRVENPFAYVRLSMYPGGVLWESFNCLLLQKCVLSLKTSEPIVQLQSDLTSSIQHKQAQADNPSLVNF